MSHAAVAQDETEDRYHTQVEAGDVRLFTLDQLDAAFNAGLIHENTYVCLEGSSDWLTLGEVAGLGDEEPVPAPVSVVQPVPQARQYAAPAYGAVVPSPSVIPAASYAPAYSVAPVTNDLSLDDDYEMMSMRPKRRAGKVVAGLAVLALGGLGFAVVQSGGIKLPKLDGDVAQASAASLSVSNVNTTPSKPVAAPVVEEPKVEAAKAEEPKAASDTPKSEDEAAPKKAEDRFSEEMKAALLNKDQKQAAGSKQKKASRAAVASVSSKKSAKAGKSSAGGFKTGGSAYDPLNSKL